MKNRFLSSYYSRLIFISALTIILAIITVVGIVFLELTREQKESIIANCDNAMDALSDGYEDIWNNYYKVFLPIYESENATNELRTFCITDRWDPTYAQTFKSFDRIMRSMSTQDSRICGIYFTRGLDDSRYLYTESMQMTQKVDMDLSADSTGARSLSGTRILNFPASKTTEVAVLGIESPSLEVGGANGYRSKITVLYDVSCFSSILRDYDIPASVRFYILSPEGKVFFDSEGIYGSEERFLSEFEDMRTGGDHFIMGDVTYLKNSRFVNRGGIYVYYTLPEQVLGDFSLSGTGSFILIFAVSVCLCILLVMLSLNRAVNKKFAALESGLRRVGKNDLQYRLDAGKHDDEFSRIAVQFNKMCDDLEDTINKNYVFQLLQKNMEYKMLQLRVNPHFLFNSLESIREKLGEDSEEEGAEMVLLLSRIFEYQARGESIVTVQQERDALEKFIAFSEIRFDHMFEYEIDFEREILNQVIPKQSLQPILENYFVHGIRGDETDFVSIRGYRKDGKNYICVRDNGKGITPERAEEINRSLDESMDETAHIGLNNVHNRLKILFGKDSYVKISSNAPEPGTTVLLVFNLEADMRVLEETMGDGD